MLEQSGVPDRTTCQGGSRSPTEGAFWLLLRKAPRTGPRTLPGWVMGLQSPTDATLSLTPSMLLQKGLRPADQQSVSFHLTFRQMWPEGLPFFFFFLKALSFAGQA